MNDIKMEDIVRSAINEETKSLNNDYSRLMFQTYEKDLHLYLNIVFFRLCTDMEQLVDIAIDPMTIRFDIFKDDIYSLYIDDIEFDNYVFSNYTDSFNNGTKMYQISFYVENNETSDIVIKGIYRIFVNVDIDKDSEDSEYSFKIIDNIFYYNKQYKTNDIYTDTDSDIKIFYNPILDKSIDIDDEDEIIFNRATILDNIVDNIDSDKLINYNPY